jgi:hypothetical protein
MMTEEDIEAIWGSTASCAEGWRVLAVAVTSRALRIIANEDNMLFRVEQLRRKADKSVKWETVSSHQGDFAFESYPPAIKDMLEKQARLQEKLKLAEHERKMATIRAMKEAERPH